MLRRTTDPFLENQVQQRERWLVSYADFITLLFGFFVVMYSISQVNDEKYQTLRGVLWQTFSDTEIPMATAFGEDDDLLRQTNDWLAEQSFGHASARGTSVSNMPASETIDPAVTLVRNGGELLIYLDAEVLFTSASDELNREALGVLATLAETLRGGEGELRVEGHTDSIPINTSRFPSNWVLSAMRAVAVVEVLAANGVPAARLSAVGAGEHRPVGDNATAGGRKQNRRVVIRVDQNDMGSVLAGFSSLRDEVPDALVRPMLFDVEVPSNDSAARASDNIGTPAPAPGESSSTLSPVRLRDGSLLFSSDPYMPRTNPAMPTQTPVPHNEPPAPAD